jgi:hypothetical protein
MDLAGILKAVAISDTNTNHEHEHGILSDTNTSFLRHPDYRMPNNVLVISPAILDF